MRSLSLSLLLLACGAAASQGFDEFVIDAGFRVEQRVLVADLYGDGDRQFLVAGRNDAHEQFLAIYSLSSIRDSGNKPLTTLNPGPDLIAYDVGRLGDNDTLLFIAPGRVLQYRVEDGKFAEVLTIRSIYGQQRSGDIVPIDFFRDINDDGRDDLIVPDTAGYRIRLQKPDGSFGDEALLEESSRMTVASNMVGFESRPLFSGDSNFDDLTDLGVWRGNTLRVYRQLPGHRYQGKPDTVQLGLGLLSEAELRALESGAGSVDQRGLTQNNIASIEDRNGDQLPDILIESTTSMGVFDKRNTLSLHLGRRQGESLVYHETADALLASEGLQYGMVTTDIDGDGLQDLVVRKVYLSFARVIRALISGNVSLRLRFFRMTPDGGYDEEPNYVTRTNVRFSMASGQIDVPAIAVADFDGDGLQDLVVRKVYLSFARVIRALISGNVSLRLRFFRMTPDGGYDEEPNYVTRTNVRFSMASGQIDIPAIAVDDFDGDGLKDLLMQKRPDELSLSRGVADESLFSDDSVTIETKLPRNGDLVDSEDVDGDGRSDLVMRYTAADGEQAANIVRLLIARPQPSIE